LALDGIGYVGKTLAHVNDAFGELVDICHLSAHPFKLTYFAASPDPYSQTSHSGQRIPLPLPKGKA
jgi:hypothetical protein